MFRDEPEDDLVQVTGPLMFGVGGGPVVSRIPLERHLLAPHPALEGVGAGPHRMLTELLPELLDGGGGHDGQVAGLQPVQQGRSRLAELEPDRQAIDHVDLLHGTQK